MDYSWHFLTLSRYMNEFAPTLFLIHSLENMNHTSELQTCPNCKHQAPREANQCLECGNPLNPHKTYQEAFSGMGLGLFDLLPGVRDLPYAMRYVITAVSIILVFAFLFL